MIEESEKLHRTTELNRRIDAAFLTFERGQLIDWLRKYQGFFPLTPSVEECLAKFPLLDREQALQLIHQVLLERAREPRVFARVRAIILLKRILRISGPRVGKKERRELSPEDERELQEVSRILLDAYEKEAVRPLERRA